jgi:hypothetical protein
MILIELHRDKDETGISGCGRVAQGVIFDNGKVALTWLTDYTSVAVYDDVLTVIAIHGHQGKTRVVAVADLDMPLIQRLAQRAAMEEMENVIPGAVQATTETWQATTTARNALLGMFNQVQLNDKALP